MSPPTERHSKLVMLLLSMERVEQQLNLQTTLLVPKLVAMKLISIVLMTVSL